MKKIFTILIVLAMLVLCCSCEKEDPQFENYKKAYLIEGHYSGLLQLDCDTLGIHKRQQTAICVTAVDGEQISVQLLRTTATAYRTGDGFFFAPFYYVGTTDCGMNLQAVYHGSARAKGDSLLIYGRAELNGYEGWYTIKTVKE